MMMLAKIPLVFAFAAGALAPAQSPVFNPGGPDAAAYGAAQGFPRGIWGDAFQKEHLVATFSHFDSLFPTHATAPAAQAWNFERPAHLPDLVYFHHGVRYTLADYLSHMPVTGLLIAQDNHILYEGYQYARTDHDRFTSQSIAKSVVGLLTGIAVSEHALGLTSTASQYLPELKSSPYSAISVRDLLHMSSGITCPAQDPAHDVVDERTLTQNCRQTSPPGTHFHYSAMDSEALSLILARAVHMSLTRYLEEKLWRNIGTESKATWTVDPSGHELAYCCFNATLRDYARLARLLAFDGAWNGRQLIPRQWLLDATTIKPSDSQLAPGVPMRFFGYGYQLWILPGPRRLFALQGANGQRIFIDPESKLILVQTAVMEKEIDPEKDAETIGLWLSLVHQYRTE